MAKKIVTLYLDDSGIRLLVSHGKRIKRWGDLPLEPGLVNGAVVSKEAEVAARIKQFLKAQKVRTKKVIVGLSGLHCLTRPITLPQLPKPMLADAVMREARRVLPVPLEQLYLSWQTIAAPEGNARVFLVAIPRNAADALLRTLHRAGLKPYLMDLKPLALARVAREATAVIVDVQPTEFDIVIMADGVPQPIRTVSSEGLSRQEKLLMVREEIDRTIKFYNSNNPEKPLVSDTPILVAGELADESEFYKLLSNEFDYPVLPLTSPLKCPERLTHYLVNIGLALKELGKEAGPLRADLNTLPAPYQPRHVSLTRVIAVPSAITIAGLLIPLVMLIQSASANTVSMRNQLDITNQLTRARQLQKEELQNNIAELEKQVAEAETSHSAFTTVLDILAGQGDKVNQDLRVVTNTLPSTMSLTSIGYASDRLTVSGRAPSEAEVSSYALSLHDSSRFAEVIIANMKEAEDDSMDFTLVLIAGG